MSLTKEQRDALGAGDFAVPAKRLLPIHDANHTKMAWRVSATARDLTPDEREEARERILAKAKVHGIDTKGWGDVAAASDDGLYVCRNLTPDSAATFAAWARGQGFTNLVPEHDLHATVVYSRQGLPLRPQSGMVVVAGGERYVTHLGDEGAVVLMIDSPELEERWREARGLGATWDHAGYQPHITITCDAGDLDLTKVEPFVGDLVFGPEVHEPLNNGWATESGLRLEAMALSVTFDAMALDMPTVDGHPNAMPFSGILVRLDEPSDAAPHGSSGKRVLLTAAAAEAALPSLLGMGVNFTEDFDSAEVKAQGHARSKKIGAITAATIRDSAIHVAGIIYAADFPKEAARIRRDKSLLGFSFEAARIYVEAIAADPLVITACVFTGAAILRKDMAAYTSTSLAASAAGDIEMTKEEIIAAMTEANAPLVARLASLEASAEKTAAHAAQLDPHVKAIEASAAGLIELGIDASDLLRQAAALRAGATKISAAAPAAVVEDAATKALKDQIAALGTQIADLAAKAATDTPAPERKTLPPQITALLARAGLETPEGDGAKLSAAAVDKGLKDAGLDISQRLRTKAALRQAGVLEVAAH